MGTMSRTELRGTRCYVELLAAQTGPLNWLCPSLGLAQFITDPGVSDPIGRHVVDHGALLEAKGAPEEGDDPPATASPPLQRKPRAGPGPRSNPPDTA